MNAEVLKSIISFADDAHGHQKRRYTDERYIVHPIRVMQMCQQYNHDICVLAAALLHDVLEDTPVTKSEIADFLVSIMDASEVYRTVFLVEELTDIYTKKNYPSLNRQQRKAKEFDRLSSVSADAQTIKYADIIDNSQDTVVHDPDFGYRYLSECKLLLQKMTSGNKILHDRASHTVLECMDRVKKLEMK